MGTSGSAEQTQRKKDVLLETRAGGSGIPLGKPHDPSRHSGQKHCDHCPRPARSPDASLTAVLTHARRRIDLGFPTCPSSSFVRYLLVFKPARGAFPPPSSWSLYVSASKRGSAPAPAHSSHTEGPFRLHFPSISSSLRHNCPRLPPAAAAAVTCEGRGGPGTLPFAPRCFRRRPQPPGTRGRAFRSTIS